MSVGVEPGVGVSVAGCPFGRGTVTVCPAGGRRLRAAAERPELVAGGLLDRPEPKRGFEDGQLVA